MKLLAFIGILTMATTAKLDFPLLEEGQSGAEVLYNESMWRLEMINDPILVSSAYGPPGSPDDGDMYWILSPGTGIWADHEGEFAMRTPNGWIYLQPYDGYKFRMYIGTIPVGFHYYSNKFFARECPVAAIINDQTAPSPSPSAGDAYIVATSPTGAWASFTPGCITVYDGSDWKWFMPQDGHRVFHKTDNQVWVWDVDSVTWRIV